MDPKKASRDASERGAWRAAQVEHLQQSDEILRTEAARAGRSVGRLIGLIGFIGKFARKINKNQGDYRYLFLNFRFFIKSA